MSKFGLTRRSFLTAVAGSVSAFVLAACFYMANPIDFTEPYPLYTIPSFDPQVATYVEHYNEAVDSLNGEYTWFEYVPAQVTDADAGTVPLIVTLHGNLNDSRCQIDASGWAELAVEEGFIVAAPEWQDVVYESGSDEPLPNFFECDGLQNDRIVTWIETLKDSYPQIDPSRIYVTGLSAGCSAWAARLPVARWRFSLARRQRAVGQ